MGNCTSTKKSSKHLETRLSPAKIEHSREPTRDEVRISYRCFLHSFSYSIGRNYQLLDLLGAGTFSDVRKAYHLRTGQYRAIKQIKKKGITDYEAYLDEIRILRCLDHPNILRPYEFVEDKAHYYIVTELCTGGMLLDFVAQKNDHSDEFLAGLMRQVFSGLAYCHSRGLAHRDLKPENILIEQSDAGYSVKIADFGSSTWAHSGARGLVGTPYYIAPEVLGGTYSYTCDLWSCGILLYILLTGKAPYSGNSPAAILQKVRAQPFQPSARDVRSLSTPARDLLSKLLRIDPSERISAAEALKHPWLTQAHPARDLADVSKRLVRLTGTGKLQRAVRSFLAGQAMSQTQLHKLQADFEAIDQNGDGRLSVAELTSFFKSMPGQQSLEEDVESLVRRLDIDGSGYIDYCEFLQACLDDAIITNREMLQYAFEQFDLNGDGLITKEELQQIFNTPRENKVLEDILREGDLDGDGAIDFEEFVTLMEAKIS